MGELRPRVGFLWVNVRWSSTSFPDACSYCGKAIPDDETPLIMWRRDGRQSAAFCRSCQQTWWGIEAFH